MRESDRRQKTLALFQQLAQAHLGKIGMFLVDKEFEKLKLNGSQIDESILNGFYDNLSKGAKLVAGPSKIDKMLEEMKRGSRALLSRPRLKLRRLASRLFPIQFFASALIARRAARLLRGHPWKCFKWYWRFSGLLPALFLSISASATLESGPVSPLASSWSCWVKLSPGPCHFFRP